MPLHWHIIREANVADGLHWWDGLVSAERFASREAADAVLARMDPPEGMRLRYCSGSPHDQVWEPADGSGGFERRRASYCYAEREADCGPHVEMAHPDAPWRTG